jgi:hypothetical protein
MLRKDARELLPQESHAMSASGVYRVKLERTSRVVVPHLVGSDAVERRDAARRE